MTCLAVLALTCSLAGPIETRILPRFDGLLIEITSDTPMYDSVLISGFNVNIRLGSRVSIPDSYMPFWVVGWEIDPDSCGFTVQATDAVDSLQYALSPDSLTMLVFFRAAEPLLFPQLSWNGPPDEPEYGISGDIYSDSIAIAALEMGQQSPWLGNFDCIVLDPGHGGRDPGAVGPTGTYEKDRTLEIALLVRDILNVRLPELRVVMTRDSDEYVSLGARTRLANQNRADLFVSVHCNASTSSTAHGFETFFLSRARTDDSRAVEMLENSAVEYDNGTEVYEDALSFLLADIAQNIYLDRSSSLAVSIQRSMENSYSGGADRGVKQAGFFVLRGALMPSVLVEVAFISNPGEEQLLKSLDFRLATAEAIVDAVLDYTELQ